MWRNYVICVLIGLLLVSTGGSVLLTRQTLTARRTPTGCGSAPPPRRATQASLQQQLDSSIADQAPVAASGCQPRSRGRRRQPAARPPSRSPARRTRRSPAPTAPSCSRSRTTWPTCAACSRRRGADSVPGPGRPEPHYLDRFNQDYLPSERESDQKLLTTLGLIGPNDSVAQILLDVLQEQVIGLYNQDDKVMYLVPIDAQFGPDEKDTFAHEYTTRCRTSTTT